MVMVVAMVGAIAAAEVITMDGGGAEAIITDGGTIIALGGDYKSTCSRVTIGEAGQTSASRVAFPFIAGLYHLREYVSRRTCKLRTKLAGFVPQPVGF